MLTITTPPVLHWDVVQDKEVQATITEEETTKRIR